MKSGDDKNESLLRITLVSLGWTAAGFFALFMAGVLIGIIFGDESGALNIVVFLAIPLYLLAALLAWAIKMTRCICRARNDRQNPN